MRYCTALCIVDASACVVSGKTYNFGQRCNSSVRLELFINKFHALYLDSRHHTSWRLREILNFFIDRFPLFSTLCPSIIFPLPTLKLDETAVNRDP